MSEANGALLRQGQVNSPRMGSDTVGRTAAYCGTRDSTRALSTSSRDQKYDIVEPAYGCST
jgi:hypothetical protein